MSSTKSIPGVRKPGLFLRKSPVEALATLAALLGSSVTTWRLAMDPKLLSLAFTAGFSTFFVALGGAIRIRQALAEDGDEARQHDHEGLRGAVHVLHSVLGNTMAIDEGSGETLRIAVHRVVPAKRPLGARRGGNQSPASPVEIEQLVPYVGGPGGQAGRIFSTRAGVTGRSVRHGKLARMHLRSDQEGEFIAQMIDSGFTPSDAATLTRGRLSYLAIPIFGGDKTKGADGVIAVIFLDTNRANAFTDDVAAVAVTAATGFFNYFNERY